MKDRMKDNTVNRTIDIPVPSEQSLSLLNSETSVEIDQVPAKAGHFSVDYRRC